MTSQRRLDWMLLLPASVAVPVDMALVIGGDSTDADAMVEGGIARRAVWRATAPEPDDAAALVVCRADSACSLADVVDSVTPGGTTIVEIDRRRSGRRMLSLRRARRAIERSGASIHGAYVVSPSFDAPRRYLPVDAPAALRWHLRNLFVSSSVAAWTVRTALLVLHRTPIGTALLGAASPRTMVVAKRDALPMVEPVIGSPLGSPGERAILLTSGYDAGSRGVVIPFGAGESDPRRVVKVATSDVFAPATRREHERLVDLHDRLPGDMRRSLPVPLGVVSVAGRTACMQSCAPGRSLATLAGDITRPSSRQHRDLATVAAWLDRLAITTRTTTAQSDQPWVDVYGTHVADNASVAKLLAAGAERAAASGVADIAVYQHYDAGPWNVHLRRGTPTFVDWESDDRRPADSLGPPLVDVLYLVTYWYFGVAHASMADTEEQSLVDLFVTRMPLNAAVEAARQTIDASLRSLGLQRNCVPALLTALWAERAAYTRGRQQASRTARRESAATSPERVTKGAVSRPDTYVRVFATQIGELFAVDGWWAFPVGTGVANDLPSRRYTVNPVN